MARVYMITEPEMNGLMDQLHLQSMLDHNYLLGGFGTGAEKFERLSPNEQNRLNGVHGAFHMICVRWAQEMGFKGGRF